MSAEALIFLAVIFYSVANLLAMGLELNVEQAANALRSIKLWLIVFLWGWVVGPAIALIIIALLPMHESYGVALIIFSLAPGAPFLPMMVRIAHADMAYAAAILPMVSIGTVVLLPLMAPLLVEGAAVSAWVLAKPLLLLVFLPLAIGIAVRVKAPPLAAKIFPGFKRLAGISTITLGVAVLWLYGPEMLGALGSFAILAQLLFLFVIAVLSYVIGFGLQQKQRSSVCLGITTRNGGAIMAAVTAFPGEDPHLMVFSLLTIPVLLVASLSVAGYLGKQENKQ